ncbi:MAG: ATP-binding protein [Gammaproteobacteria bacterium]
MKRPASLTRRVMLGATLLLGVFFSFAFVALDGAFRRAAEQALEDLLESQVLGLLTAADPGASARLILPNALPETRFSRPGSGLYAQVTEADGETVWISASATGLRLPAPAPDAPGRILFKTVELDDGTELLNASLRVEWEFDDDSVRAFVFSVASGLDGYRAQIKQYRTRLGSWFFVLAMIIIAAQIAALRFLLRPLGQAEQEVRQIEAGERQQLSDGYPRELGALAGSVNTLIEGERARSQRFRESLDNLAHSLKTPLAVVRNQIETGESEPALIQQQVDRMQGIVDYQLRRAASGAATMSRERTLVSPAVEAICDALAKVYAEKSPQIARSIDADAMFPGERGDLTEILGNLLDNACKWCKKQVRLEVRRLDAQGARHPGIEIVVEDDGPGIPVAEADLLVQRGIRGDQRVPGHGIGLAVVRDIITPRGGELAISLSGLGGTRIEVRLPGA